MGSGDGKNLGCLGRGQWCQKRSVLSAREDQMADGSVRQERHSYFALGIMERVGVGNRGATSSDYALKG